MRRGGAWSAGALRIVVAIAATGVELRGRRSATAAREAGVWAVGNVRSTWARGAVWSPLRASFRSAASRPMSWGAAEQVRLSVFVERGSSYLGVAPGTSSGVALA